MPPRTAWDHYALGRLLLSDGDLPTGRPMRWNVRSHCSRRAPGRISTRAPCAYRRGRFAEAESAFRVCIALEPDCAPCRYNHGLAEAALDQPDRRGRTTTGRWNSTPISAPPCGPWGAGLSRKAMEIRRWKT